MKATQPPPAPLLKDVVATTIYNYPTLYRVPGDPELSRLLVLNHLFLQIGNGYDWHKDGYLYDAYNPSKLRSRLPAGFWERELWYIRVDEAPGIVDDVGDSFHYHTYSGQRHTVVFESTTQDAIRILSKYVEFPQIQKAVAFEKSFKPREVCEFSGLMEIWRGKTAWTNIEQFTLHRIRPDWFNGAFDVARAALEYHRANPTDSGQIKFFERFLERAKGLKPGLNPIGMLKRKGVSPELRRMIERLESLD